ncbi:TPA: TniQ family protein [Staphylococcus aureus]|uniref:TnsD family Tn7-like transposition protein n=1 Tax=Staphylococcus aureus TaxID=1280 RepID=UPI000943F0C7|nr:TnsD family Tn7-like transposition protein [Staphylococcus aureus]AVS00448.1 transposase [Staphylococcus aureus]MBY0877651.1 TniQ family protein [Staphylococcus aureus]MBZ5396571.1 TniQ family protein [Staphylococcus aureus]MCQ9890836.1 TnsD family transposase [Staphylococcus aureus]MCQ9899960.1 TnsD family transposase [Staphylococcus aureus]
MLPFFTNPYPDELLYSAIARYHFYSGNLDCKDTLEELFDSRSVIPSMEIGSHLTNLVEKLGPQYSVEYLLANHTIYPYYASFLSKQRQMEILEDVKNNGQALYTRLGIVAGGICRKDGLYYCDMCAKSDSDKYREPYIHREHQLQGISYCAHHEIPLREYPVIGDSRIEYIRFELRYMNLSDLYEVEPYEEIVIQLAKQAYKLLKIPLHSLTKVEIDSMYKALLRKKNLITAANRVRQQDLYQMIKIDLSEEHLTYYESNFNEENEYNWVKVLTRNSTRHVNPLRHLLILLYLKQDVGDLIVDNGPFRKGPYPCLNRAAKHYKKLVIPSVKVTRDFKTKAPIGTFCCSCGFVYARKGPDNNVEDQYRIGRIKAFGHVWRKLLKKLLNTGMSIRAIAKELGVDPKTVKKYAEEPTLKEAKAIKPDRLETYRNDLSEIMCTQPQLTRTEIRNQLCKQYMYLYRYAKEWLMANLPIQRKYTEPNRLVDWNARDREYVQRIKALHQELLTVEKPVRITNSLIWKRLGITANIEGYSAKLPSTTTLLNEIIETVKAFQIRRCCKVIDQMLEENEVIKLWKVQRIAAIKSHHFHEIKKELSKYIQKSQGVKRDEPQSI